MDIYEIPIVNRRNEIVASSRVDQDTFNRLGHLRFVLFRVKGSSLKYAVRNAPDGAQTSLHRMVLGDAPFERAEADHVNRNGLDNRRANLRWATHAQNMQNLRTNKNSRSGHRGVQWDARAGRWCGAVKKNGVKVWRRYFSNVDDAAVAVAVMRRQLLPYAID